ncbi:MAG: hypothetical protein WCW64_11300 [Phycisphaerae bacterium]|jgi:hypothetical protein
MRDKIVILVLGVLLYYGGLSRADVVQLDLFSLGMPATFNFNNNSNFENLDWHTNFDLGVTFTQISHVYMNWSGEITGGLATSTWVPGGTFPASVEISAHLKNVLNPTTPSDFRYAAVVGGATTYPDPQPFDISSEFVEFLHGSMPLSELFDGRGTICLGYLEGVVLDGGFVQHGYITLDRAILVIDGTVVPEPATLIFFAIGLPVFRVFLKRKI